MNKPKITIIIPTKNGGKYLPYCVESVISQKYDNLELIISSNLSTDNTDEYLSTLKDPRITILHPNKRLSLSEHYEFALSHASGDWIMLLGDDDGVQSYFFDLVPYLIEKAEKQNLNLICSERAYFYWKGCKNLHPGSKISYSAQAYISIEHYKTKLLRYLSNYEQYFCLPQMYTTSLFRKNLIEQVKSKQNGLFFNSQPPDADAAAVASAIEERYLYSAIPIGWVGTSTKSYGALLAFAKKGDNEAEKKLVEAEKEEAAATTNYPWHKLAGDPILVKACNICLWQAFLCCEKILSGKKFKFFNSKICKYIVFAGAYLEDKSEYKICQNLKNIIKINGCNLFTVKFISKFILPVMYKIFKQNDKKRKKKYKKLITLFYKNFYDNSDLTLADANKRIAELGIYDILIKPMVGKSI